MWDGHIADLPTGICYQLLIDFIVQYTIDLRIARIC